MNSSVNDFQQVEYQKINQSEHSYNNLLAQSSENNATKYLLKQITELESQLNSCKLELLQKDNEISSFKTTLEEIKKQSQTNIKESTETVENITKMLDQK